MLYMWLQTLVENCADYIKISPALQLFLVSTSVLVLGVVLFAIFEVLPIRHRHTHKRVVPTRIAWMVAICAFLFSLQYTVMFNSEAYTSSPFELVYVVGMTLFALTASIVSQGKSRHAGGLTTLCIFAAGLSVLSITASEFIL
jgi:hypothetical protein